LLRRSLDFEGRSNRPVAVGDRRGAIRALSTDLTVC
jgi:hypothetical protein